MYWVIRAECGRKLNFGKKIMPRFGQFRPNWRDRGMKSVQCLPATAALLQQGGSEPATRSPGIHGAVYALPATRHRYTLGGRQTPTSPPEYCPLSPETAFHPASQ